MVKHRLIGSLWPEEEEDEDDDDSGQETVNTSLATICVP